MELIITEKDNAARRIADILSDGQAVARGDYDVGVYEWDQTRCIGLSGHVVSVDFPEEYNDWRDVEPVELIDAPVEKRVTRPDIVATVERLAEAADRAIIATDYDREGELIGKEAYEIVRDVAPDIPVDRVRFSSITEGEVREAFAHPDEIDFDLAAAGEARQIVDLVWGAALTRYLSLSAGRLGDDFISVGRVQSPTLKLIVDREREIEAFDPETYWELTADLQADDEAFSAQYYYLDDEDNEAERIWSGDQAETVFAELQERETATVQRVNERTRTDHPPAPFNTTQFIRAAGAIGYGAQRAMSIAEDLYTAGHITYPRTDNTVYPDDLDPEELLATLSDGPHLGDDAERLLADPPLSPTAGDEETTDHPPIHPTGQLPDRADLDEDEWQIYELVVRRFYATLADPAVWRHLKVAAAAGEHRLKANGKRLVEPGYHAVYPYYGTDENIVPAVTEGQDLAILEVMKAEKETQPPRRFGQSRLIEKMEELGIGTKCLAADTRVLTQTAPGEWEPTNAADLFEAGRTLLADGDVDLAECPDPVTTMSLTEHSATLGSRTTDAVSKRSLRDDESVVRVQTDHGRFAVTAEHPLYVVQEGGHRLAPAREVSEGDHLLATRPAGVPGGEIETMAVGKVDWEVGASGSAPDWVPLQWSHALARLLGAACVSSASPAERLRSAPQQSKVGRADPPLRPADIAVVLDTAPEHHGSDRATQELAAVIAHLKDRLREQGVELLPASLRDTFLGGIIVAAEIRQEPLEIVLPELPAGLGDIVIELLDEANVQGTRDTNGGVVIKGRRSCERVLDRIPLPADQWYYAAAGALEAVPVVRSKAELLCAVRDGTQTPEHLARRLRTTPDQVRRLADELTEDGHLEQRDREDGTQYQPVDQLASVYDVISDRPGVTTVRAIEERPYKGPVYDLSVSATAPNFTLAGGVLVHNSTRHHTIEKLYERGYVEDDPPRPTELAKAVVDAGEEFAELVTSEEMTAQLEADMAAIANGEADLSEVTEESREILERVFADLMEATDDIGELLRESLRADRIIGPCPDCGEDLLLRQSNRGSQFIGCDGYPDCEYTLPLPSRGDPLVLDAKCETHGLHEVKMLAGRNTFVHGCPQCRADEADEAEDIEIGACPDCGEEKGGELAIKRLRSGSRLVGCTRYPDCEYSLPLPRRGEIEIKETRCTDHDLPELTVHSGDDPWELGCPICNYQQYQAEQNGDRALTDLDGIGEKTAEKLSAAGIESIDDLQNAQASELAAELDGVTEKRIREWQVEA